MTSHANTLWLLVASQLDENCGALTTEDPATFATVMPSLEHGEDGRAALAVLGLLVLGPLRRRWFKA